MEGTKNVFLLNKSGGRLLIAVSHGKFLMIKAGCFWGTLKEFKTACKERYPSNPKEGYELQIEYLATVEKIMNLF